MPAVPVCFIRLRPPDMYGMRPERLTRLPPKVLAINQSLIGIYVDLSGFLSIYRNKASVGLLAHQHHLCRVSDREMDEVHLREARL
jgi:hypothetical protein